MATGEHCQTRTSPKFHVPVVPHQVRSFLGPHLVCLYCTVSWGRYYAHTCPEYRAHAIHPDLYLCPVIAQVTKQTSIKNTNTCRDMLCRGLWRSLATKKVWEPRPTGASSAIAIRPCDPRPWPGGNQPSLSLYRPGCGVFLRRSDGTSSKSPVSTLSTEPSSDTTCHAILGRLPLYLASTFPVPVRGVPATKRPHQTGWMGGHSAN